jgi:anti-sigma regulatory factor (Ser/Thr protein kinase)
MVRFVDADTTLAQIMVDGVPEANRFKSVVGGLIDSAGGGRVCVYGEMVQLLWEAGNVNAAVELESLWNDLGIDRDFSLYCAYRSDTVSGDTDARDSICRLHSALVGTLPRLPDHLLHAENIQTAELMPTLAAPGMARRLVIEALQQWEWAGDHQVAALIVSELSTNAVVHAHSPFRVCITRTQDQVRISVTDLHPGSPVVVSSTQQVTSGRGLSIISDLADRWDHDIGVGGKEVWAELHSGRD